VNVNPSRASDASEGASEGRRLGPLVDSAPAERPIARQLAGRHVTLTALDPGAHARSLYEGSHGPDADALWHYLADGPYDSLDSFTASLAPKAASSDPLFFAIVDNASGDAVGYASFMRIEPQHRVIEVGSILYTRRLQHTAGGTEAMYLMAREAFDTLCYRRYEWKCNQFNEPSLRAAARLGFMFEGAFRQHMIVKGRSRDTAWFSMLDTEWPRAKRAFEAWLAPSNFDANGQQREKLADIRSRLA
jgi:RimJ/RimL family protein N-acetyltransferase